MSKTAIILFNLGGPDRLTAVRPFLRNLFNDPAIINLPTPIRWILAQIISWRRAPIARQIYAQIGGRSPLLEWTRAQAVALEAALADLNSVRVFTLMRYWHPRAAEIAEEVKRYSPDQILLLPLYPQFSTTTTASSIEDWKRAAKAAGLQQPTLTICCYPEEAGLVAAQISLLRPIFEQARALGKPRILFSAHGLPQKIIANGDPYQWQIEQTVAAIVKRLAVLDLDWKISYQSRVGPLEWIKPYTEDEIIQAGKDKVPLIILPIAFVSEHSETLVELDIEYRHLAEQAGVPAYYRVPAIGTEAAFIHGLAKLVRERLERANAKQILSGAGWRICPPHCSRCAMS